MSQHNLLNRVFGHANHLRALVTCTLLLLLLLYSMHTMTVGLTPVGAPPPDGPPTGLDVEGASVLQTVFPNQQRRQLLRRLNVTRCGCSKLAPVTPHPANYFYGPGNTTCEEDTFWRGPGQNVVGFTFYEPVLDKFNRTKKAGRNYYQGVRENLRLIKQHYPGWIMRLYYQIETDEALADLCYLACSEPYLDICEASQNARLGNASILYPLLWRYLPVIDVQVDNFLSRDLDSRINSREVAAVREFFSNESTQAGKYVHVMRDHPAHATYIMGGLWGAKVEPVRTKFLKSFKRMFKDGLSYAPRQLGGYDQACLGHFVWPWAKKYLLGHDSYLCEKYSHTAPFPTRREEGVGNYVGSVVSLNGSLQFGKGSECPVKCRPRQHQDWIYC